MGHISVFRAQDLVSRYDLDVPLVSSDFNVKNDDERHRISVKYDETHKTVDTYVDRHKVNESIKNDTNTYRISLKYDPGSDTVKTFVNDREIKTNTGAVGFPDYSKGQYIGDVGSFTAPENGYLFFAFNSHYDGGYCEISINGVQMGYGRTLGSQQSVIDGDIHAVKFFMVSKGDVVQVTMGHPQFVFYPCHKDQNGGSQPRFPW